MKQHSGYRDRQGNEIDVLRFAKLFDDIEYRYVAKTFIVFPFLNGVSQPEKALYVCTIWLGFNALLSTDEDSSLFETTVFRYNTAKCGHGISFDDVHGRVWVSRDEHEDDVQVYATEAEAFKGHDLTVKRCHDQMKLEAGKQ